MNPTKLLYLDDMRQLQCSATVQAVEQLGETTTVYLDKTVFYPQGGGQPYDMGTISSLTSTFMVKDVRYIDGAVAHKGSFNGAPFALQEVVQCSVDPERRTLNSRLHSGGHVVDMAVDALGFDWKPTKAYHFPDSPYGEYEGSFDTTRIEAIIHDLQQECTKLVQQNLMVNCRYIQDINELKKVCKSMPENFIIPVGKPMRVVFFNSFGIPCGGTHVNSLKELGNIIITKLKQKGGTIRVGYDVPRD